MCGGELLTGPLLVFPRACRHTYAADFRPHQRLGRNDGSSCQGFQLVEEAGGTEVPEDFLSEDEEWLAALLTSGGTGKSSERRIKRRYEIGDDSCQTRLCATHM